jgi:primosomal protein N' (replication factor Y)
VVVMGSATPDVETYYHASTGQGRSRTRLLELPDRIGTPPKGPKIAEGQKSALARVSICDMREELREGNRSIFSRGLAQALKECVNANHQAILFLNRRGSAPFVQCRDCGYVLTCPSCTVTLTFHSTIARLVCHRCNRRIRTPHRCRQCGGERIRQLGIGTQRVVDEVTGLLPGIRVERWDADSSRSGNGPEQTMAGLASGEIQVLVGTQMVAKGLDLPNVTLVGAILADVGLHLPDFRAGERAFSLLCQVAGRAGRGPYPGRVIIQTYNPEHYAIAAAATQDYSAMYRQEIQTRQAQGNPPFNQLAQIRFQDLSATSCQRQATALARLLRQRIAARGLADVEIAGPAPGIPERIRGHYRWNVLVRGRNLHRFLEDVRLPPNGVVDVDPAHLL